MTAVQQWEPGQWIVFSLTIAAGVAALALLWAARSAVLGWTAPAPMRRAALPAGPRPSLVLAAARAPLPPARPIEHDPMVLDYSSHGPGALRDLLAVEADPALRTSAEIAAELDAWVHAYADLSALMPETARAREALRVATEPAMRKARLWLMRAGESGARAVLAEWRMDTPTGEYPAITDQHRMARALLVS